jgi:hypothetical protein
MRPLVALLATMMFVLANVAAAAPPAQAEKGRSREA